MTNEFGRIASFGTTAVGLTDGVLAAPTVGFGASVKATPDYTPRGMV